MNEQELTLVKNVAYEIFMQLRRLPQDQRKQMFMQQVNAHIGQFAEGEQGVVEGEFKEVE